MTLLQLLDDCARSGILLTADGDKLRVRATEGDIPAELQEALRRHKSEILARLRRSEETLVPVARTARRTDLLPLSIAQESLWFLHRVDAATLPAYNIRKAFILEGALDAAKWTDAFAIVVDRHPILRSSFFMVDDRPFARVASLVARCEVADLTYMEAGEQMKEVERRLDAEGRFVFDLSSPPLFRATLLKLSGERHAFILNAHHLIADAWSAGLVLNEMSAIYDGRESAQPAISFTDWVEWERERVARGALEPHLDYWKEKLAGLPALELPSDFSRTRASGYDGASEPYVLPRELSDALRAFSAANDVTLFSAFVASFAAVLHRYSGQVDFPIGTSVAGRTRTEIEQVVGLFADLIVLRMDAGGSPSFTQLARRVHQVSAEAFEHQDVPFELLVKSLRPQRVAGQNPLFQVLFLFLQSESRYGEVQVPSTTAKFDLSLHVEDTGTEVRGLIEYRTARFQPPTIRHFLGAWLELLHAAVADPSRPVTELPITSAEMRSELLYARNQVEPATLQHATLADAFAAQAARTPDRTAVKDGMRTLTYRELEERAERLARALRARGVGPEVRVGLQLERSLDIVVAIVGVLKAGGVYVPFDPSDPPARLEFMREDSGVAIVIDDVEAFCSSTSDHASHRVEMPLCGSNAAYVIYTSGSTGQPRGVVVTHDNVLRLMASTGDWFSFDQDDVWTLFHSYAFDFSVWEIWGALLYGGRVVVVPQVTARSPETFHQLLREEGVTVLNQTPSAFRSLIPIDETIPSLRYVILGGEALDLTMLGPWFERYGDDGPCMVNMYGITETTVHVTWRRITQADAAADRGSLIGSRIPDLTLYILDGDLQPVPEGVTGQLHVGGAGLSRGYLRRPSLTAERFIPDPYSSVPGARLYRTGDVARWRGADIEYLGRSDEQVKIRGFRIEPGEIENVLRSDPRIRECAVVARDDASEGGGRGAKRLIAYYIPGDSRVDAAEMRALCAEKLPSHMVPVAYIAVEEWPRTRNDKLDRARLPLPELDDATAKLTYVAPRNDTERTIAGIWSGALGVRSVGIHDDFFALGGDSILSLDVLSQMRRCGLESSVAQLYQHHSVAELAGVVARVAAEVAGTPPFSLVSETDLSRLPDGLDDAYPLSQLQAGMLYEEQLNPERALYHDIFSFHLRLPYDAAAWSRNLQEAVDRHPALRTEFDLTHFTEPLQLVRTQVVADCTFLDLTGLDDEEQERRIAGIVAEERDRLFAYDAPPLLRFYVAKRADDRSQIIFGFHHAILDGWSVAVLFSRLLSGYCADLGISARPAFEPMPAVRHADYVAAERASLLADEDFWRGEVAALPVTVIPRSEPLIGRERTIVTCPVVIPESVSEGLARAARAAAAPLKSALLAAHLRVLGAQTGQPEAVTGLVTNGRPEEQGADRILGLFLNTLPLRVDLASGTFVELIRRTFEAEQRLLQHRRYPMAAVKRLAGGRPLFDAAFNFVHFHVYQEVMQTSSLEVIGHQIREETDFPFLAQFSVFPGSSRVELSLIYDSAEFASDQIEAIAASYLRCLEGIAVAPHAQFREHSLLSAGHRALIEEWGGVARSSAEAAKADLPPASLVQSFEAQVKRASERIAVTCEGESLTYRELDARANRLAHYLRSRGVKSETLVGLCLERSLDLVVGILAILKAGGAYVPLDPSYPVERLRFIIEDSRVALVVTHAAHEHLLNDSSLVLLDRDRESIAASPSHAVDDHVALDQAAYVIYTSGSTGRPKGVVVTHGNAARLMAACDSLFDFTETDVWTLFHSYAFDFSVWEIWGALIHGARVVVVPFDVSRDPQRFHRLLVDERVTILSQTPSAFYQLMPFAASRSSVPEFLGSSGDSAGLLARSGTAGLTEEPRNRGTEELSLRYVIFGGEALDIPRLRGWMDRHGDERPQLVNMYGITETTVHVTWRRVVAADADRPNSVIGRPLPHLYALVLDPAREVVPIGVVGELYVGGHGVARGYLHRDELTASRFVEGPYGRLYRTGDLARWSSAGELEYMGRIDSQVKIRGFRIELGEIEYVLRGDESVRDAVVVMRDGRLIAYVVTQTVIDPAELRSMCAQQLPDYMVPAVYVALDSLPLTANGKLDRDALPDPDAVAVPQAPHVPPRSEVERQLCAIWEEVLAVPAIGIDQSFFELGGHSLHATQLMARVRELFAVELPLRTLFEQPTVEKLAITVAAQRAGNLADGTPSPGAPTRGKRRTVRLTADGEITGGGAES